MLQVHNAVVVLVLQITMQSLLELAALLALLLPLSGQAQVAVEVLRVQLRELHKMEQMEFQAVAVVHQPVREVQQFKVETVVQV